MTLEPGLLAHRRLGEGVAQVGAEVEGALFRDSQGVGDGLRALPDQALHLLLGLQGEVMVGPDVGERLVDGGVVPGGRQRVLPSPDEVHAQLDRGTDQLQDRFP